MKRFLFVAVLLLGCLPIGVSIAGCGSEQSSYCDATNKQRVNQPVSVLLEPQFSSVSLAFTQTRLLATPTAKNCLGSVVAVPSYVYSSTNPSLLDVAPNGNMCAGSWNRNTGGGIANYTICSAPSQATIEGLLSKGGDNYSNFSVQVTASAGTVTSNPVTVFSHPQVSSVVSYPTTTSTTCTPPAGVTCNSNSTLTPSACVSQSAASASGGLQLCSLVCAEALVQSGSGYTTQLTDITSAAGQITYTPVNTNVVNIGTTGLANPIFPGSTVVTANVSGVTASAGLFSTCPPVKMQFQSPGATTPTFISVAPGNTAALQLTTIDSTGASINPSGLAYTSSTPSTIGVGATGIVSPLYGGNADVYASCLPPACNPSPLDYLGLLGNGDPVVSNAVRVNAPGTVSSIVYMANFSNGPYFSVLNTNSNVVTPVQLPYNPNSMVISQDGSKLYFGSDTELMSYYTSPLGQAAVDLSVPGKVLAVAPNGTTLVISGQTKPQVGQSKGLPIVYIYTVATATYGTEGTVSPATRAQFSADGNTIYILAGDQEYIYSLNNGWTIQPVVSGATNGTDVAVLTPSVGAFYSGANTQAVSYCGAQTAPPTTAGPGSGTVFYPATSTAIVSDRLGISNDGLHLFAATSANSSTTPYTFTDACVSIAPYTNYAGGVCTAPVTPSGEEPVPITACPDTTISTGNKTYSTAGLLPANATVTGVPVSTTNSLAAGATTFFTAYTAFLTYEGGTASGSGAVLPYYQVFDGHAAPAGLSSLTLKDPGSSTAPQIPTAGVVSPDNSTLYVTTSGDAAVHFVTIPSTANGAAPSGPPFEDTSLNPPQSTELPGIGGGYVPADAMVVRAVRTN